MDDATRKKLDKEIDKTVKQATEEVRGRELTPTKVWVRVVVETKEGHDVRHHSDVVDIPAKK